MKRVGVIGGGQLAWMMASAAKVLGVELVVQTPSPEDPAVAVATDAILAPIDDVSATARLAASCDVITFENEFVDLKALSTLPPQTIFRPGLQTLAPLLDKYDQRCYLRDLGLPVPKFFAVEGWGESLTQLSFPTVLKARRHGYDGQGTAIIKDIAALRHKLEASDQNQFLLEEFVPFERELAIIAARSATGKVVTYPIVETQQEKQVCRRVLIPADITSAVANKIEAIASTLLNSLQAVGIFGIELFLTSNGTVLVNEVSPRTHNSGHFTIEACETSQFEQHLRTVCDLPLGNSVMRCGGAVMVNLLGHESASGADYSAKLQQLKQIPHAHIHWYGKTESRPGRKLGHITVLLDHQSQAELIAIGQKIELFWYNK